MVEKASLGFRLRKIYETRNYLVDEIKHNDLISKKDQKTVFKLCWTLAYSRLLILASTITDYFSISAVASFHCVHIGITSSVVGINICSITV